MHDNDLPLKLSCHIDPVLHEFDAGKSFIFERRHPILFWSNSPVKIEQVKSISRQQLLYLFDFPFGIEKVRALMVTPMNMREARLCNTLEVGRWVSPVCHIVRGY